MACGDGCDEDQFCGADYTCQDCTCEGHCGIIWQCDDLDCGGCNDGLYCNGETYVCEEGTEMCNNSCVYAGDGDCDDGGLGCDFDFCEFGSDCDDCGVRTEDDRLPPDTECPG